jgi:O-antigen/teichoic acid export membrane protein
MLRFSGVTFAAIIASNIIFRTDNIVIGIFLGPEAITMYSVGFMLSDYVSQLIGKMCNALTPKFSEHESRGETQELNALIINSTRFSALLGIPMGLAALVMGKEFIQLWLGPGFGATYYIMAILMCGRMCGFPTAPIFSMLYGIGAHHIVLYTGIIEAVSNLVLSIILVKILGVTGVAWGTLIPNVIANIFFVVVVFRKLNFSVAHWIRQSLVKPLLLCVLFFAIIYTLEGLHTEISWEWFIIKTSCLVLIYITLFAFMGITGEERKNLANLVSRKIGPLLYRNKI